MAERRGKTGRWITTDSGNHVFVEDGKSVEEALAERFDEEYVADAPDYNEEFVFDDEPLIPEEPTTESTKRNFGEMEWDDIKNLSLDEILENVPQKEIKEKFIKSLKGKLKSYTNESSFAQKYVKDRFKKQLAAMDVQDEQLFSIINDNVLSKGFFKYIRVKSAAVRGSTEMSYDRFGYSRVKLNASPTSGADTTSDLFHELGHCLDHNGELNGNHLSSTFISKKYNDTLSNVLKDEMQGVANDIVNEIKNLKSQHPRISSTKVEAENYEEYQKFQSYRYLEDMLQGSMGNSRVKQQEGINTGHKKGYFEDDNGLHRGTEFFAELTDNIINDKNKTLLNICKKHLPKTTDIYFEILEEKFGYGRK